MNYLIFAIDLPTCANPIDINANNMFKETCNDVKAFLNV